MRLSEAAWRGWERLSLTRGATKAGLCEAMGELLAEGRDDWLPDEVIARARVIDRERRRRT